MGVANPYAEDLGDRVPIEALVDAADRIRQLAGSWSVETFEKSSAPGKWSARQILIHTKKDQDA